MKVRPTKRPIISVIMPTWNEQDYVTASISSILNQTFSAFEFIIIDDGSSDDTPQIVRNFPDERIRFYSRPHLGTVYQLNFGLAVARGKYIARQDGDDSSKPERFEQQVHFLDTHPEYAVVSSAMELIDEKGVFMGVLRYPAEPDYDKLLEKCCISHPASMWRREINESMGGYDEAFNKNCCEDYDFWLRVVERYRIYVIDHILYTKREHGKSSIAQTRWTYVPIYDELARSRSRMRRTRREMET